MTSNWNIDRLQHEAANNGFTWSHIQQPAHLQSNNSAFSSTSPVVNQSDYERAIEENNAPHPKPSRLQDRPDLSAHFTSLTLSVEPAHSSLLNVTLSPVTQLPQPPASPITDYNRALRELEQLARDEEWENKAESSSINELRLDEAVPNAAKSNQPISSSPIAFRIQPSRPQRSNRSSLRQSLVASATSDIRRDCEVTSLQMVSSAPIETNFRTLTSHIESPKLVDSAESVDRSRRSSARRSRQHFHLSDVRAALDTSQNVATEVPQRPSEQPIISDNLPHKRATYSFSHSTTSQAVSQPVFDHPTAANSQPKLAKSNRASSRSTLQLTRSPRVTESTRIDSESLAHRLVSRDSIISPLRKHFLDHSQQIDNGCYETSSPSVCPLLRNQLGSSFGTTASLGDRSSELSEFDEEQRRSGRSQRCSSKLSSDSFSSHSPPLFLNPRRAASVMKSRRKSRRKYWQSDTSDYSDDDRSYSSRSSRSSRSTRASSSQSSVVQLVVDGHAIADVPLNRLRDLLQLTEPSSRKASRRSSRVYA